MNDDARDDPTNRPVSLNNVATPDAAIFTSSTAGANSGATLGGSLLKLNDGNEDFEEEEG